MTTLAVNDPFPSLIMPILALEGGYSNDPDDAGGETCYGVTVAVARAAGYEGAMKDMPYEQAISIYRRLYWQDPHYDELFPIFPGLAEYLLNIGINVGPETATCFLQRGLNALLPDLPVSRLMVDGVCGPVTRGALTHYHEERGDDGLAVILGVVKALAVTHYIELAEQTARDKKFEYGWLRRSLSLA